MWLRASDGTAVRDPAGLIIREVEVPDRGKLHVVAAMYAGGQTHHDIRAFTDHADAVREVDRLIEVLK